jgi:hypothetical protein
MAEKNTLSILETIKKKMSRLDGKTDAPEALKTEPQEQKSSPTTSSEDFNLDDLDLDVEIEPEQKGEEPEDGDDFTKEDVEDYEDGVDFTEEEKGAEEVKNQQEEQGEDDLDWLGNRLPQSYEMPKIEIPQPQAPVPAQKFEEIDDIDLLDLDIEPKQEAPKETQLNDQAKDMIHDSTTKKVADSMKKLVDVKSILSGVSSLSQSPALFELAVQLMEPKLEEWLNENLPDLVEKVIREEIEKLLLSTNSSSI